MRAVWGWLVLGVSVGCEANSEAPTCPEPVYGGRATDEAWHSLVDAYDFAREGHADASEFWTPQTGDVLSLTRAPRVTWTRPLAAQGACPQGYCNPSQQVGRSHWSLFPAARAHLPPISGDIYFVEFLAPEMRCAIATVTTDDQWLPSASEWARLSEATEVELRMTSAFLEDNRVVEGPFRTRRVFQLQP